MATLVAKNPRIVKSGTQPVKVYLPAAGSQTWKAGEFATVASGLVTLVATTDVDIKYYLLEDQDSATSAGDLVACILISNDMIFEGNVLTGTVSSANQGMQYGISVASNVFTVKIADATNKAVQITEIASTYEPSRNVLADTLALVRFKFIQAVLEA